MIRQELRPRDMDTDKPCEVAFYSFTVRLNGDRYIGRIPALNAGHAENMVKQIGGELMGRLLSIDDIDKSICSICGGDVKVDMTHPKPILDDDFPEEFDSFGE
jgi:hypothetical protein